MTFTTVTVFKKYIFSLVFKFFLSYSSISTVAITQGGAIQLTNNGTDGVQGIQTLTAAQPGATILQYAQTSDGQQILVPSNQVVVQGETACTSLSQYDFKSPYISEKVTND